MEGAVKVTRVSQRKKRLHAATTVTNSGKRKIARTSAKNHRLQVEDEAVEKIVVDAPQKNGRALRDLSRVTTDDFSGASDTPEDRDAVKRTKAMYEIKCLEAVKSEQARVGDPKAVKPQKNKAVQKRVKGKVERTAAVILAQREKVKANKDKSKSRRPDLVALSIMNKAGLTLLQGAAAIGRIRGIVPGARFSSRAEMVVLGLHTKWLCGIDYLSGKASPYGKHVCTAICISGGYEDDEDHSTEIEYTGQGGNDLLGKKGQYKDQKLEAGNLALKNSIEIGNPVRVIRGHAERGGAKAYTFDGMYQVVDYYVQTGQSKFKVFKFKLKRLEGQPDLTTDQVKFINGKGVPKSISDCPGVVCKDLSNGLEKVPIVVTNTIDTDPSKQLPPPFEYITECVWPATMKPPKPGKGCKCIGECIPSKCACADPETGDFHYIKDKRGKRLTFARGIVGECGPNCGCSDKCTNRNAQLGVQFRLEVYKTANKGWAVRSWDSIPAGSAVCFYVGEVVHEDHLRDYDVYVLDLDALRTAVHGTRGREAKYGDIEARIRQHRGEEAGASATEVKRDDHLRCEWAIDAARMGNVARFINHSCDPNLFYQPTLWDHQDINFAHPVLFAAENIPPMTELTYDYNYALDSVKDEFGNIKQMPCYCASQNCSGRLY